MRLMFQLLRECVVDAMQHFRDINPDGKVLSMEMRDVFARSVSLDDSILFTCMYVIKANNFRPMMLSRRVHLD